jgi:hypothetical protein
MSNQLLDTSTLRPHQTMLWFSYPYPVWQGFGSSKNSSGSGFSGGAETVLKNVWQNGFTLFFLNGLKSSNVQYALR